MFQLNLPVYSSLLQRKQVQFLECGLAYVLNNILKLSMSNRLNDLSITPLNFYPRDAMLARVFAIATCLDVCLSVCLSHAGIVPSKAKAGS